MDFNGGTLRNAIPREAFATVAIASGKSRRAEKTLHRIPGYPEKRTVGEREEPDRGAGIRLHASRRADRRQSRDRFVQLLNATPNGVIRNSDVAKGVVETSLNVGVVTMSDDSAEIICLIRSLIDSGKEYVVSMLESLGTLAGAKTAAERRLPGLAAGCRLAGDGAGA